MNCKLLSLLALLVLALSGAQSASAAIKCWKNHEGVRECGDSVPPEFAQQESETKDKHGVTIGTQGRAKSMEELNAEQAATEQARLDAIEANKRAALDRALLDTFASEDDLVLARDGQIAHLESQIRLTEGHIEKLKKNLDQLIERAADVERRGEQPTAEMLSHVDNVRGQIAENEKFITTKRQEQGDIRTRFDADIARFRELKGVPAEAAVPAASSAAATQP